MKGPVCTIHIGLPKTGSTSIQKTMLANRDRLARHGIYVPETGTDGLQHNHQALGHTLLKPGRPAAPGCAFSDLRGELERAGKPDHVLISAESMNAKLYDRQYVLWLRGIFSGIGYRLRLVAYLRPQVAYINSFYSQNSKYLTNTLDMATFVAHSLKTKRYDYRALLMPAFRIKGIDTDYRPFNRELIERGIVEDFLTVLGLDSAAIGALTISPPLNVRPGPKSVAAFLELSRRVMHHALDIDVAVGRDVRRAVLELGDRLGWNEEGFSGIDANQAALIRGRFARGNDVFSSEVWARPWDEVFGADCWTPAPFNAFDRAAASSEDARAFDDLVERVWQALRDGRSKELAEEVSLRHVPPVARPLVRRLRAFSADLRTRLYTGTSTAHRD